MLVKNITRILGLLLIMSGGVLVYFNQDYPLIGGIVLSGFFFFGMSLFQKKVVSNLTLPNFINVFTHFRVALDGNANVYRALSSALSVTSGRLYEELEQLLNAIGTDHSITPFISFARPFKHRLVTHIMINVFMLVNHGLESKRLWQFNYVFETLVKEYGEDQIAAHQGSYERFDVSLFMGTAALIFTLMSSVISMLGAF